jgi:light-regulated signal transduction histidine kinase (bacteriophytochrome)
LLIVSFLGYLLFRSKRKTQASNVVLEEEVKRRTVELLVSNTELQTTNARLEQSNSELERFAYIASHDLKSPLRNIISFLNLIDRKVRKLEDTDLKEYLRFATDNARQMHVLIQDVLEFSRIESDKVTHLESVDLNESLMLVLQNLQEPMQIKGVNVQSPILPVVQTNGVHIMQVFQNLIGNGIKYNESGNPTIQISFSQNSNEYQFAIHDNGIGIAPEYHDQIFEMFKRLHTRDEYKGTGIGLAICKKIVINLGGRIWIDSQVGNGATFFFTIPYVAEKQLAA